MTVKKEINRFFIVFLHIVLNAGHAPANFAFVAVLSFKLHFVCFQQVQTGSDCPLFSTICRKTYRSFIYPLLSCLNFPQILKIFRLIRNLLLLQTLIGIAPDTVQNNRPQWNGDNHSHKAEKTAKEDNGEQHPETG